MLKQTRWERWLGAILALVLSSGLVGCVQSKRFVKRDKLTMNYRPPAQKLSPELEKYAQNSYPVPYGKIKPALVTNIPSKELPARKVNAQAVSIVPPGANF